MQFRGIWVAAAGYAIAAVLAVIFAPGWFAYLEQPNAAGADRVAVIASARQAVLLAAGGLIALIGVVVSLARNSREAGHAALERDQHWTQRYMDAGSMLGSESEATRLAGIYAMHRLGREAEDQNDVDTVISVISSLLRHTRTNDETERSSLAERERAALIESLRGLSARAKRPILLQHAYLVDADLTGAGLSHGNLTKAVLAGAVLPGADLAHTSLAHANLTGANLNHVTLASAKLNDADLTNATLIGANLAHADLSWAHLAGANLTEANLDAASLLAAKLIGADLTKASLAGAFLSGAFLRGAKLTGADLTGADLTVADLTGADLTGANFKDADITGADFRHASGVDLTGAKLREKPKGNEPS